MQSGIDTSRTATSDNVTRITVGPQQDKGSFFSADGPSFRDVLDAINPLEHIPFVNKMFDEAMDHQPSVASKLVGGALLGGPIGFVASLANVIFESTTGNDVAGSMVAALTGGSDAAATQVASNDTAAATAQVASNAATDSAAPIQEFAALSTPSVPTITGSSTSNQEVLSLYGGSQSSAHSSYKKAQMLPYLRDVTTSQVL